MPLRAFYMISLILTSSALTQVVEPLEFADAGAWQPAPTWLGNPADKPLLRAVEGVAEFRVEEPGRGMKWSKRLTSAPDLHDIVQTRNDFGK